MKELEGKTAVVTGAGSGIGRALAIRFATAGMHVALADVEEPKLAEVAQEVDTIGPGVIAVPTDVSEEEAIHRLRDEALDAFGAVHVVCNNAGVGGGGETLADWQWVMNVNFWGVVHGLRTFLPLLQGQNEGHIVNTASMAGIFPGYSPYSASKWAVVGISEGLYSQLSMEGSDVGVSCLCPGWVRTSIIDSDRNRPEWATSAALDDADPDPVAEMRMQFVRDSIASGRQPEEVAGLVHDAVVNGTFWVFTDETMVAANRPRYEALLAGENPPSAWTIGAD
ncbi:MAG: SDR family NAD(P)-dependent oxidoreductase [Ilumatobacteraceae bacterium]|nr:SDR family NAD(P)-dependent oxidoreductase [Ilumatobacteraceae bacterium]